MPRTHVPHRKMSTKKKVAASAAAVLIAALLLGGAFAWTDFTQAFTNIFHNHPEPDVLLHDDFTQNKNKDVYVENTGNTYLYVRVNFYEYLQVGNKVVVGNTSATPAVAVKDKSTYQLHRWSPLPDSTGKQSKWNLASSDYYDWYLTGAQKLYLPGTSEIDDVDYAALGYKAGDVPSPTDGIKGLSGNGNALKETMPASPVVTMAWFSQQSQTVKDNYVGWILDESDGYAYWSQKLAPGYATDLLLDKVLPKPDNAPDDNSYYAIDVRMQAANATEVYKFYTDSTGKSTISPEAEGWISQDALKPPKKGPTLPEKEVTVTGDGLSDAQIAALKTALSTTPVPTDDITALGLNNAKQVYQAAQLAQDALNAEIVKGSPDPALIEQLAREASSLEALGDRMTDANPPDGELDPGDVVTVDSNGFAKVVDQTTGDTLLNALNFPDPALLNILLNGYQTQRQTPTGSNLINAPYFQPAIDPGNGMLTQSELEAVTGLCLNGLPSGGGPYISTLDGLELFPELQVLQVWGTNNGQSFIPANSPKLKSLIVASSGSAGYSDIDLTHNPDLEVLAISSGSCYSLDLSQNTKLNFLQLRYMSNLKSIDLRANTNLKYARFYADYSLSSMNLDELDQLDLLQVDDTPIASLDLRTCTVLRNISLAWDNLATNSPAPAFGPLTSLNVAGLANLQTLSILNQSLASLDLTGCTALITVNDYVTDAADWYGALGNGPLTTITGLSGCAATLKTLTVYNQSLNSLDLSATGFTYNNSGGYTSRFYNNNMTSLKVSTGTLASWQNASDATNAANHLQGNFGAASGDVSAVGADTSKITQ